MTGNTHASSDDHVPAAGSDSRPPVAGGIRRATEVR